MDKGRMEFAISFLEPGRNSAKSGKVQIFVYILYINSNCIFSETNWRNKPKLRISKTIWKNAQWRRVELNFR